jgi:hypothetical protein
MGKENLERVFNQASAWDIEVARNAWFRYQRLCGAIAQKHGFPMEIGAAVFAALSPNSDYHGNLRDTDRLLAAARAGQGIDTFSVSAYGNNKHKAWRLVHGEEPLELIVAPKTRNFFLNISDPTDPLPVTVDGHIFNAWANERLPLQSAAQRERSKHYQEVAEAIRQIGAERRLLPNVVQGLIWHCWKRLHHIRSSDQLEFWGSDYLAAGLGFGPAW